MLVIKVDLFPTVRKLCSEIFAVWADLKFQLVGAAVSKIHSQTVTTK